MKLKSQSLYWSKLSITIQLQLFLVLYLKQNHIQFTRVITISTLQIMTNFL